MRASLNLFRSLRRSWRRFVASAWLRCHGVEFGAAPSFAGGRPIIQGGRNVKVGAGLRMKNLQHRVLIVCSGQGRLVIGDHVLLNQGVNITATVHVSIGDNTQIGDMTCIYDTSFHSVDEKDAVVPAPVHIGRNVWLARNVIVMPGVRIGDHSVVAAGSVVTQSIPAKTLAAGAPARFVRDVRCSDNYIRC